MTSPRVATRIQHHPERAHLLPRLTEALSAFTDVQIVTDPEPHGAPDTWRVFRRCLESMPVEATHLLTVQDDALPRTDFACRLHAEIEAHPESVLLPFTPGFRWLRRNMLEAQRTGTTVARFPVGAFVPLVAACFPRAVVTGLLDWADNGKADRYRRPIKGADDGVVAWYCRLRRIYPLMLVPSICDHDDEVPSVGKNARQGPHRRAAMLG